MQVRPVAGLMLDVKLTVPAKPLRAVIVIVEVPVEPAMKVDVAGDAVTVKSWT